MIVCCSGKLMQPPYHSHNVGNSAAHSRTHERHPLPSARTRRTWVCAHTLPSVPPFCSRECKTKTDNITVHHQNVLENANHRYRFSTTDTIRTYKWQSIGQSEVLVVSQWYSCYDSTLHMLALLPLCCVHERDDGEE